MGCSWDYHCGRKNKHCRDNCCDCGASKNDPTNRRIRRELKLMQGSDDRNRAQIEEPEQRSAASG